MKPSQKKSRGVSLVEVVIGAGIMATLSVAIFSAYTFMSRYAMQNTPYVQASMLAEEGIEAVKVMRDFGWNDNIGNLTIDTDYRLVWSNSRFSATTTPSLIDNKFDRYFTLADVYRDGSFNIVSSPGTLDTGSKKVTVTVAWRQGNATTTKTVESYIFNSFSN